MLFYVNLLQQLLSGYNLRSHQGMTSFLSQKLFGEFVRIKPQTKITIKCKYNQYQEIIDHTEKNTRHQDLTWFTQSLGYVHQTASPIYFMIQ